MVKKIKLIVYFLYITTLLLGENTKIESVVLKIVINKKEEMIEGKIIEGIPYIRKEDFLYIFELDDKDKKLIKNLKEVNLDGDEYINLEKESENLNSEKYEFDESEYTLDIKVPWKMRYEEEIEREKRRKRLKKLEEESYEKEEWKLATPGILNVGYAKNDFSESDEYIYYNYTNNLFYGSSNIDGEIQKNKEDNENSNFEVNYAYWERDVLDNKRLNMGDSYRRLPFNVGDKNDVVGFGIGRKNSWDSTMTVTEKHVKGYAPTGTMVELYENGILREYQIVTGGEYSFKIDLNNGSKEYTIRKYLSDGKIVEEKVNLSADEDILPKGEFDYYGEVGEFNTYNGGLSYGAFNDLTLVLGGFNILGENGETADFISAGEIGTFPIPYTGATAIHSGRVARSNKDNFIYQYSVEISKGSTSIVYKTEDYSELEENLRGTTKKNDDVYISDEFKDINFRVGTSKTEYDEESKEREHYGYMYKTFYGNILVNLGFSERKDLINNETEKSVLPSISYMVDRDGILYKAADTISLSTNIVESDTQYGVNISKNYEEWDYYLGYNIDNDGDWSTNFTLSWTPGKKAKIQTSIYSDNKGTKIGSFVETNLYLAENKPQMNYSDSSGKGSIEGLVYIDKNGDGRYEKGIDKIIPEAKLETNGAKKDIKGSGSYALGAINTSSPEKVKIAVDNELLPYNVKPKKERKIKLNPGGRGRVDFGFVPIVTVLSTIQFNNGFYIEEVENILKHLSIEFENLHTGKVDTYKWGNSDIFIKDIEVGDYAVTLVYAGDDDLKIDKSQYYLKIQDKEETEIDFEIEKIEDKIFKLAVKHDGAQSTSIYEGNNKISLNNISNNTLNEN